jgi:integrase
MSLYKRGLVWFYDFKFGGRRHRGSTKVRNQAKARQIEEKLKTDLALGRAGLLQLKPAPQFRVFAGGKFTDHIEVHHANKPQTVKFYAEKIRRLLEFAALADAHLNQIDADLIERYVQFRAKKGRKPGAINRELATLRKGLNLAAEWKLLARPPKIRLMPGETGRDFVLTYAMEKAYLAAAPNPLNDVAVLGLDTGLRLAEALALQWTDLTANRDGDWIYLTVRSGKSANAHRSIPLTDRGRAMLTVRREVFPDALWVFPGQRKGKHLTVWALDNIHAQLRRTAVDADGKTIFPPEFVIHSLRHTFGTRLGETGANPYQIMKLMGHSSLTVSQKYVHPTAGGLEAVMRGLEAMNRLVGGETVESHAGTPTVRSRPGS